MQTFRTLEIAVEFYDQITRLRLTGHLKEQLDRSASSISLNLSEGNGKASAREKRHFFQTAYASLRECQTIFRLIKLDDDKVIVTMDRLGASLYKLINSQIKNSPNWH